MKYGRRRVAQVEFGGGSPSTAGSSDALALSGFLQVEASAEAAARTGDEDDANVGVAIALDERLGELREHRRGNRVHALRTIQGDGRDVLIDVVEDLGFAHWGGSRRSRVGVTPCRDASQRLPP